MKKSVLKSLLCVGLVLPLAFSWCACSCSGDRPQETLLEVTYLATGEAIHENQVCEFVYDGQPKIFGARVKLTESGEYLENGDFTDGDLRRHIGLWIQTDGSGAYTDAGIDPETDWPAEIGEYEIMLEFDNNNVYDAIPSEQKYYSARFYFAIIIKEQ